MIIYKRFVDKVCPVCGHSRLGVAAFVYQEFGLEKSVPLLVCSECKMVFMPDEVGLSEEMLVV